MTLTQKKQRSGAISGIGCGMTKCDTNVVCNMERQRVEFPRIKAVTVPQNGKNIKTQATKRLPRPFLTSLITLVRLLQTGRVSGRELLFCCGKRKKEHLADNELTCGEVSKI